MADEANEKSGPEEPSEGVICEFFGIKITTNNPNLARVLAADVGDIMKLDVREVKDFINSKPESDTSASQAEEEAVELEEEINTNWNSISNEIKQINKMLGNNDRAGKSTEKESDQD